MNYSVETVYKCKLCGESLDINLPVDSTQYIDDEVRYFLRHPQKAQSLIHKCDNGGQGVLEFVGIKSIADRLK